MQRGLFTTILLATVVGCGGATRPAVVVRVEPRAATPAVPPALALTFDPSLTIVSRQAVSLVSKLDHDDRVFALAEDGTTLVAIDTRVGKELWRSKLAIATDERVSIYPDVGAKQRVVVHAGYELVFVDRDTGTVVTRADTVRNYKSIHDIVSTVEQPHGACVVYAECTMQPIDCDDGRRIGPELHRSTVHLYRSLGEPHDTVCRGEHHVVGRAANVVVAVTDAEPPVLTGLDARSGAAVWSRPLTCQDCSHGPSGVTADGTTCWISGGSQLEAFTCATGRSVFTRALTPADRDPKVFTAAVRGGGIFVADASNSALLDPKLGRSIWSKHLDAKTLGLPLGTPLDLPELSTWGAHTIALLDPKDGHEVARFDQPSSTELRQSADLGVRLEGGPAYDAGGVKLYDHPPAAFVAEGGRGISVVATHASASADIVVFQAWSADGSHVELIVAQRAQPH